MKKKKDFSEEMYKRMFGTNPPKDYIKETAEKTVGGIKVKESGLTKLRYKR